MERQNSIHNQQTGTIYTCPMHPEIVQNAQGNCPLCKMNLVPLKVETGKKTLDHQIEYDNSLIELNQDISILYDGPTHSGNEWKGHFSNMR